MEENLTQAAIQKALNCEWKEAIKINLSILEIDKEDIDALNRLSRAYFESGNLKKAKEASSRVIKIDPNNNIAKNSIEKYKLKGVGKNSYVKKDAGAFIEEPGKTKITTLINLGSESNYSNLSSGDEVLLTPHTHKVSVITKDGKYIGKLADDLSARIRLQILSGNKFFCLIKLVNNKCVKIFIRSSKQSFPLEMSESLREFKS